MWRVLTIILKTNENNKPIGFFDSGVGGLTVLSAFRSILPNEDCIFFGDTKNMPYGEKTKEQLIEYSTQAFMFFEQQNAKAVIMACNTTSAMVYDELKDKFNFKLYPLIQTVTQNIANMQINKIGVFATPATVESHAYAKNIKNFNDKIYIREIACPTWVKIVENGMKNSDASYKNDIKIHMDEMTKFNPDKIVLGCTHYPYLIDILSQYAPIDKFINPAEIYAKEIKKDLTKNKMLI